MDERGDGVTSLLYFVELPILISMSIPVIHESGNGELVEKTKVLITGSLGYLGSMLTEYLAQHGCSCVGYDTGFFRDCLLYPPYPAQTVLRDARDITEQDLEGINAVVHLAGISNDPFGNLDAAAIYDPTRRYAKVLAEICKRKGVRFVFASSCSVYGKSDGGVLNEDSKANPQTPYSLNKLQVEEDLRLLADKDFSPIALRFATAFGLSPRIRFDLVINMFAGMAAITKKIILNSDGNAWRPNVHVLDICQAIRCAVASQWHGGELLVLNVGDDANNMQIVEIAKLVQKSIPGCELKFLSEDKDLDKEGLVRDRKVKGTDTRTYQVSFEKIKKLFPDFRCEWTIEKGVREMAEKFRELPLTEQSLKNINFYRLQKIERLYLDHCLSDDLRWIRPHDLT